MHHDSKTHQESLSHSPHHTKAHSVEHRHPCGLSCAPPAESNETTVVISAFRRETVSTVLRGSSGLQEVPHGTSTLPHGTS